MVGQRTDSMVVRGLYWLMIMPSSRLKEIYLLAGYRGLMKAVVSCVVCRRQVVLLWFRFRTKDMGSRPERWSPERWKGKKDGRNMVSVPTPRRK